MGIHQLLGLFGNDVDQRDRCLPIELVEKAGKLFGPAVSGIHQKQVGGLLGAAFEPRQGNFQLRMLAEEMAEEGSQ